MNGVKKVHIAVKNTTLLCVPVYSKIRGVAMKKTSIAIPTYNEHENINIAYNAVMSCLKKICPIMIMMTLFL